MILGAGGLAGDAGAVATILADVVRDYVCVQTFPGNPEAVGRFVEEQTRSIRADPYRVCAVEPIAPACSKEAEPRPGPPNEIV